MAKRHVSASVLPPSLTLSSRGCRSPRAGVAEGSLRCRQFWSNICPRKNKSPLSLTTGRASLVSNRALLNRRRITDPRGPSIQATHRFFLSLSLSLLGRPYPARPIFFFFFHWQQRPQTETSPRPYLWCFYRKFYRIFTIVISLPFAFDCQPAVSRTNAIKISRSYEECGDVVETQLSRPNTSLGTHRDFANLSRFLPPSFFR